MPQISKENIAPYVSLLIARTSSTSTDKKHVGDILADIMTIMQAIDDRTTRTLISAGAPGTRGDFTSGFLHYEEKRRPTWIRGDPIDVYDYAHEVIVVCQKHGFVAICSTSTAHRHEIAQSVRAPSQAFKALGDVSLLETGLLNAAFVGKQARTLWLSGLHRRTPVKADTKVLSGVNLNEALSPVGDQSYAFSAVRSHLAPSTGLESVVGVTPRKATMWTRASRSWDDFQEEVSLILDHIADVASQGKSVASPIPILSTPATGLDPVESAYDMSVISPDLLDDDPTAGAPDPIAVHFAYNVRFEVTPLTGPNFRAKVIDQGVEVGTLDFTVRIQQDGSVVHDVEIFGATNPTMESAKSICGSLDALNVYYDSGHTLTGALIYLPQFQDRQFRNWSWTDFSQYKIHREKPLDGQVVAFDRIGLDNSLFSWVVKTWPVPTDGGSCWLVCDDGANEVADFVALRTGGKDTALLSLIHVKGSHSKNPNRQLSTTAFEIVTGQAQKNLRSLSHIDLVEVLRVGASNATKQSAWMNGKRIKDRSMMLKALAALGANYEREVVIVQPSARRSEYTKLIPKQQQKRHHRRAQLDMLLLGAESACFDLGARLRVVADER